MPGKGRPFTKGDHTPRRKGRPNKVPAALKDLILQPLAQAGGVDYLTRQAEKNPSAFLALVGRVLPLPGDPHPPSGLRADVRKC